MNSMQGLNNFKYDLLEIFITVLAVENEKQHTETEICLFFF